MEGTERRPAQIFLVNRHKLPSTKKVVLVHTVGGHKLDHLAINSTTGMAAKARVNPALPATAAVEFMAKWLNLYPRTVLLTDVKICRMEPHEFQ